uniref:Uncharacterized protein n=1 Tax=Musa balbisiana TaxID=52838 RepID=E1UHG9_MUSBA|nr:Hypothetical protein MbP036B13g060 [Musa balbisiana]CBW30210.1 Hypothetical protein MbP032N20cg070 [Musa balbisiana]
MGCQLLSAGNLREDFPWPVNFNLSSWKQHLVENTLILYPHVFRPGWILRPAVILPSSLGMGMGCGHLHDKGIITFDFDKASRTFHARPGEQNPIPVVNSREEAILFHLPNPK